jgi:sirohydrochlorin cobaltochelatase
MAGMGHPARAIILFGHGSRDPAWRRPMEDVARRIAATSRDVAVRCAYLELDPPDFASCVRELVAGGVTEISVVPMFIGMGRHVREDLPQLVGAARDEHGVRITQRDSVGEDGRVLDLIARICLE